MVKLKEKPKAKFQEGDIVVLLTGFMPVRFDGQKVRILSQTYAPYSNLWTYKITPYIWPHNLYKSFIEWVGEPEFRVNEKHLESYTPAINYDDTWE